MKNLNSIYLAFCGMVLFSACANNLEEADLNIPPQLPVTPFTYDDDSSIPASLFLIQAGSLSELIDNDIATLGRVLFYDPKLSATNRVSCASCHLQEAAFSDVTQFSEGFANQITERNAMPISNMAFQGNGFFWDLRVGELQELISQPIENHIEMGMENIDVLAQKLATVDYYDELFQKAYGDSDVTPVRISSAVTQFMQSMVSLNAKFDVGSVTDFQNFTPMEELGRTLFFETAGCESCHNAPTFSSRWGGSSANIGLDMEYADPGITFTNQSEPFFNPELGQINTGHFKIPSLRNIELTGPYMHDGRFNTLEEVVEHYNSGIQNHPYLDWRLKTGNSTNTGVEPQRLNLSPTEKQALVAFLKTLTDETFTTDVRFSNPFVK